ncbi:hypothetical protein [Thetidibacter halocola]|uniref:Uncharacterized protein n=1 Tax=Thetidibacter halocola TaxID=2827239 RepID=A0A8J7WD04_9RHOB|nr:hypothetical protein [Thetidibacter halocola]MBS0125317.1 hypothetical protein [Thetidibacter halocola]
MRLILAPVLALSLLPVPALAQDDKETLCRERADLVIEAFNARRAGDREGKVRRDLQSKLDRTAGEMLAAFVFSVPEAQLTDEQIAGAGAMFFEQCKGL